MTTYTFQTASQANEGYILSGSATVANARNGTGSTFNASVGNSPADPPSILFGINAGTYYDALSYIEFDTSSLTGKNILSAKLTIYGGSFGTDTQSQQLQARLYDYGASLTTADWRDPTQFSACTLLAHLDGFVAAMATPGNYDLVSDALAANINKSGATRIILGSSLHASAGTPTGYAGLQFNTDHPSEPTLTVTTASFSGFDGRARRTYLRR